MATGEFTVVVANQEAARVLQNYERVNATVASSGSYYLYSVTSFKMDGNNLIFELASSSNDAEKMFYGQEQKVVFNGGDIGTLTIPRSSIRSSSSSALPGLDVGATAKEVAPITGSSWVVGRPPRRGSR